MSGVELESDPGSPGLFSRRIFLLHHDVPSRLLLRTEAHLNHDYLAVLWIPDSQMFSLLF